MAVIYRATARQIWLNRRVLPLAFGHYAWLKDWKEHTVDDAGSGLFVAPGLGLGAKHVSKAFEKLDDRIEAAQQRMGVLSDRYTPVPAVTQYAGLMYQPPAVRFPTKEDIAYWGGVVDWPSADTDITLLQAEPISVAATAALEQVRDFFEWQLIPPERGSKVDVFGFPGAAITVDEEFHVQDIQFRSETVQIVEVFDVLQTHGFTAFPGFQIDRELAHGYSGGPVFYENRFVGTFSGPAYVASLWPLLLHEYPDRDDNRNIDLLNPVNLRQPLKMRKFVNLFEDGTIRAVDLKDVAGRVQRLACSEALDGSKVTSRCDKLHATFRA